MVNISIDMSFCQSECITANTIERVFAKSTFAILTKICQYIPMLLKAVK